MVRSSWLANRRWARNGASGSPAGMGARPRSSHRGRLPEFASSLHPARKPLARLRDAATDRRHVLGSGRSRSGRLAAWAVHAGRPGCGAGGSAGPQVRDRRRDRPGRRASDHGWNRGGAGEPAAGGIVGTGRRPWHALSGPPGPDDPCQRRARVCPGRGGRRGLAFSGSGAVARSGSPNALARRRPTTRGTARGAWASWASCRPSCAPSNWLSCGSFARRLLFSPAGAPTRPPGWNARESPPICTSPRRACSTSIFATDLAASCSRDANAAGTWARGPALSSGNRRSAWWARHSTAALPPTEVSLVFAGGIHDARSAALVAALAGPLAARGVKVGILVGTGLSVHARSGHDRGDRVALPG